MKLNKRYGYKVCPVKHHVEDGVYYHELLFGETGSTMAIARIYYTAKPVGTGCRNYWSYSLTFKQNLPRHFTSMDHAARLATKAHEEFLAEAAAVVV